MTGPLQLHCSNSTELLIKVSGTYFIFLFSIFLIESNESKFGSGRKKSFDGIRDFFVEAEINLKRATERTNVPEINFLMINFFLFLQVLQLRKKICNHEKGTSECNHDIRHAH